MKYKSDYPLLIARVTKILGKYDLLKLIELGCPEDEYSPESPLIVANLKFCKSEQDIQDLVNDVFRKMFGLEEIKKIDDYKKVSKEIWSAYKDYIGETN